MLKQRNIVPLRGGFGNQLFCWAYGVNLQVKGQQVSFDAGSSLGRGFALEGLIEPKERVILPGAVWRRMRSLNMVWRVAPFIQRITEDETRPPVLESPKAMLSLHWGYWQSHDYFADATSVVGDRLHDWLRMESATSLLSCGVHVRRGDYVNDAGAAATLGAQPLGYYHRAIAHMEAAGFSEFVVYTDDREWVAEHLISENVRLAPDGDATSDFTGLASSAAVIMSNSSFSWWAAYLASRRGVPVVGPANWFSNGRTDASRLMREGWERL
ncbi:UNVERIFIED_ORG: hypothetical protein ABIB13_003295 [Arthrobacter sp. UYEF2]